MFFLEFWLQSLPKAFNVYHITLTFGLGASKYVLFRTVNTVEAKTL